MLKLLVTITVTLIGVYFVHGAKVMENLDPNITYTNLGPCVTLLENIGKVGNNTNDPQCTNFIKLGQRYASLGEACKNTTCSTDGLECYQNRATVLSNCGQEQSLSRCLCWPCRRFDEAVGSLNNFNNIVQKL